MNVRLHDGNNKCFYKYSPEHRNHHHKSLYAIVKGNHIYTLNNNLNELQQRINDEKKTVEQIDEIKIATSKYYINEKKKNA